jgi:hypothetical protein
VTNYDEHGNPIDMDDAVDLDALDHATVKSLVSLMSLIGRNVIAGKEKVYAIRKFQEIIESRSVSPTPATIEAFALQAGKQEKIAASLREFYTGVKDGKQYLDYARRPIT